MVACVSACANAFRDAQAWDEEMAKGDEALRKQAAQEVREDTKAAREKAVEKDDIVAFLRSVDLQLLEHVEALAKAKLRLSVLIKLSKLTETQLEADLKEAGLPAGSRRQLASALQEAMELATKSRDNALREAYDCGNMRAFVRRVDPQLLEQIPSLESAELSLDILKLLPAEQLESDLMECGLKPDVRSTISSALEKAKAQTSSSATTTEEGETEGQVTQMTEDDTTLLFVAKYREARVEEHGRTGGASVGDFVYVFPNPSRSSDAMPMGGVGKLQRDLHANKVFEVQGASGYLYLLEGDIRKATDAEAEEERIHEEARTQFNENRNARVKESGRTGGASVGDLVYVFPNRFRSADAMPTGGVGKLQTDDQDSNPFRVEGVSGWLLEGDIRKATDAEIAAMKADASRKPATKFDLAKEKERNAKWDADRENLISKFGRTGGALVGDYVMITPFARQRDGILMPGEIGKLIDSNAPRREGHHEKSLHAKPLAHYTLHARSGKSPVYCDGDIRRATFEDAIVVFKAVRQKAYEEDNLLVFLICSLVKDVDGTYALLKGKSLASLADDIREQNSVPVGARRKLEKTLELVSREIALQKLQGARKMVALGRWSGVRKMVALKPKADDAAVVVEQPTTDASASNTEEKQTGASITKKRKSSARMLSFMSSSSRTTDQSTTFNESAREQAYDANDLRGFIGAVDESLVKYADVLDSHELTLDLLKTLSVEQLEAVLRESELPVGVRLKLASALDDAAPKGKTGLFSCMSSPKSGQKKASSNSANSSARSISGRSSRAASSTSATSTYNGEGEHGGGGQEKKEREREGGKGGHDRADGERQEEQSKREGTGEGSDRSGGGDDERGHAQQGGSAGREGEGGGEKRKEGESTAEKAEKGK